MKLDVEITIINILDCKDFLHPFALNYTVQDIDILGGLDSPVLGGSYSCVTVPWIWGNGAYRMIQGPGKDGFCSLDEA
jgi:hypothetical protein